MSVRPYFLVLNWIGCTSSQSNELHSNYFWWRKPKKLWKFSFWELSTYAIFEYLLKKNLSFFTIFSNIPWFCLFKKQQQFFWVPFSQSIFFHCSLLKEGVDIWNRNNDTLFSLMLYFCWSIPNQDTIQLRNCTDPLDTRTYNFLSFLNWYIQSMLCNQSLLKICSNKKSKLNTFVILVVCYFWNTYLSAFIYCNL